MRTIYPMRRSLLPCKSRCCLKRALHLVQRLLLPISIFFLSPGCTQFPQSAAVSLCVLPYPTWEEGACVHKHPPPLHTVRWKWTKRRYNKVRITHCRYFHAIRLQSHARNSIGSFFFFMLRFLSSSIWSHLAIRCMLHFHRHIFGGFPGAAHTCIVIQRKKRRDREGVGWTPQWTLSWG